MILSLFHSSLVNEVLQLLFAPATRVPFIGHNRLALLLFASLSHF
jgi:hypothetical protein